MRAVVAFLVLTACAGAVVVHSAACEFYRARTLVMPEVTATGDFLRWFTVTDVGLRAACQ